jgi:hypothetical protein
MIKAFLHSINSVFLTHAIFIPFLIGIFKWKKIDSKFHPFIIYLGMGCLAEFLGYSLRTNDLLTPIVSNTKNFLYSWLAGLFLLEFIFRFNQSQNSRSIQLIFTVICWLIFGIEYFILGLDQYRASFVGVFTLIFLIYFELDLIIKVVHHTHLRFNKKGLFFILLPMLFFDIFYLIFSILCFYTDHYKIDTLLSNLQFGYIIYNFFTYLLYSIAFLWFSKQINYLSQ